MHMSTHGNGARRAALEHGIDMNLMLGDVLEITKLSKSVLYVFMGQGLFPENRKLFGVRAKVWKTSEIARWMRVTDNGSDPHAWLSEGTH